MIPFLQSVANLNAGLSFELPLSDAGAGIASLVPLSSLGSATPTYTRASSAYTRLSNGVWSLISTGQPRSMYSAAGVYLGYWSEGARADVLGSTAAIRRTMADAGWVAGATMTKSLAIGMDGVADAAACMTGGAVEATNTVLFTTVLGSAGRTFSAWVRRKTGTGVVRITDNGGTNWTDITLTTTYQLFQVTRTQANPVVGFQIATNLDAIEVDFNTIEAAINANRTPIPVNVSKAADSLTYPAAGNWPNNLVPKTLYFETYREQVFTGLLGCVTAVDGAGNGEGVYINGATLVQTSSLNNVTSNPGTLSVNTASKVIATANGSSYTQGALNGVLGSSNSGAQSNVQTATTICVGLATSWVNQNDGQAFKNIRIQNRWLSAAQLAVGSA